jgi:hypothetical protein
MASIIQLDADEIIPLPQTMRADPGYFTLSVL